MNWLNPTVAAPVLLMAGGGNLVGGVLGIYDAMITGHGEQFVTVTTRSNGVTESYNVTMFSGGFQILSNLGVSSRLVEWALWKKP